MRTYAIDLADYPDAAIVDACRRFRRGDVEGHNKAFAPSIAEFITEVKNRQEMQILLAKNAQRPRIERQPEAQISPEERERVKGKMAGLVASLDADRAPVNTQDDSSIWDRVNPKHSVISPPTIEHDGGSNGTSEPVA